MTAVSAGYTLHLRDATPRDNESLIALTAACTMHGDIALRMDRAPDFFTLSRLEGDAHRIGVVVDDEDRLLGCVSAARREAFVNGAVRTISYVSDLKVHPSARRSGVADLLTQHVRESSADFGGLDVPCVLTVLGGNAAMENRARGPRGAPVLSRFASLCVSSIPLLWKRRERVDGVRVRTGRRGDLEAMAAAWRKHGATRQLATSFSASSLASWIDDAPGLDVSDYLLAFDDTGRLRGFMGVWNQMAFKQMRVVSYSPRLALARRALNALAPLAGSPGLPDAGGVLPALAAVHVCAERPAVLRALILAAYDRHRCGPHAFLTVGLDRSDPLRTATRGLLAQPTIVNAFVTTPGGRADPEEFSRLPLQLETALV